MLCKYCINTIVSKGLHGDPCTQTISPHQFFSISIRFTHLLDLRRMTSKDIPWMALSLALNIYFYYVDLNYVDHSIIAERHKQNYLESPFLGNLTGT